jgi:hypothetical protein
MNVYLDKPRVLEMNNGTKALSFTFVLYDAAGIRMVIPGFRLMTGEGGTKIHPPAFKLGKKGDYYPMAYLGPQEVAALYQALVDAPWPEKNQIVPLAPYEIATAGLLFDEKAASKLTPGLMSQRAGA